MSKKSLILVFSVLLLLCYCGKKGNPVPKGLLSPMLIKDLRGEIRGGLASLSFTPPEGMEAFRVFRRCGTCGAEFEHLKDVFLSQRGVYTVSSGRIYFYDEGLLPGFVYAYKVVPVRGRFEGPPSNTFSFLFEEPPAPPEELSARFEDGRIRLHWKGKEGVLYNVYRLDRGYPISPLNVEPLIVPLFVDRDVARGRSYTYEVRGVRRGQIDVEGKGRRIVAEPVDTIPPAMPRGVRLEETTEGISLTWSKNEEEDLLGYNVYRVEGPVKRLLNGEPLREERFLDREPPGLRYFSYFVTAIDLSGNESEPSREVIVVREE